MSIDTFLLSADTTDLDYPEVRPTLDLNFARVKALDPRITFTRASGGTYVGADGLIKLAGVNEARFDHDPVTGESLGLLIEESRTNLVSYSEQFDNAYWGKARTTISLTNTTLTAAPDGTFTAEKVIEDAQTGPHHIFTTNIPYVSGQTYTNSVYVKAAERTRISMRLGNSIAFTQGNLQVVFNLSSGTIVNQQSNVQGRIENVGNGWYRCSATSTATVTANDTHFVLFLGKDDSVSTSYPGDNSSGVFVWGAQLEVGAFPTSYIPTVASTRTRAADNASITGKNFSDFFNFNEGTSYVSFKFGPVTSGARNFVAYTTPQNGNVLLQRTTVAGFNHALSINFPGMTGISIGIPNTQQFTSPFLKANSIFSYKNGDIAYSTGGRIQYTNNTTFLPLNDLSRPVVKVNIGSTPSAGHLNGHISRLTYFPKRLPNAQLQALTR
jgi:hypothetical protein